MAIVSLVFRTKGAAFSAIRRVFTGISKNRLAACRFVTFLQRKDSVLPGYLFTVLPSCLPFKIKNRIAGRLFRDTASASFLIGRHMLRLLVKL